MLVRFLFKKHLQLYPFGYNLSMKIEFLETPFGQVPVIEFLKTLSSKDQAIILAALKNVEELGFESSRVQFKRLSNDLWEIKIRGETEGYTFLFRYVLDSLIS